MHTRRWDHQAIKLRNKRRHQVQELYGSRPTGFQRTRGCAGPCLSRSRVCVDLVYLDPVCLELVYLDSGAGNVSFLDV